MIAVDTNILVYAHRDLIHGEKTDWVPRMRQILESGDARPFTPFDRHGFGDVDASSVPALLDELESLRRANLAWLTGLGLGPAQLALPGRHPELGPVTLGQLLATWVVHDLNHVSQVVRVMSARYASAVGGVEGLPGDPRPALTGGRLSAGAGPAPSTSSRSRRRAGRRASGARSRARTA